ncbi:response regulator transcription factor [Pollutimonas bauzanensis]|uniref:DNA-binding response regulator, OmpR family, contains REC and winged-helix (WHTH) domain n=1 Tax=Pollutimonas bauzanensis TaxID=658167 RepID=A0A1M6A794_9BURK|nr:response regulator transcription factor [Pollutimonas bauzanensis]SHI32279.1 DNA-binding response regulator, OmpR family, contains REC and winged-helix (wHTH) domain [Pollutimonas bauzanensis]
MRSTCHIGARLSVLIVEDDPALAENLFSALEAEGFAPDAAYDAGSAIYRLEKDHFDILVLDIGLPGMDGYRVLTHIRDVMRLAIPVLVLTARNSIEDKITGFSRGADDYLTKPYALVEVVMRLRALLRRSARPDGPASTLRCGELEYDVATRKVSARGLQPKLTRKCLQILEILMRNPGVVISRAVLEDHLWQGEPPSSDALRSQIHLLRKALGELGFDGIETVHGLGWKIIGAAEPAP